MFRTKHVVIAVALILTVLVALLVAVRALAPEEAEVVMPAAVFSSFNQRQSYPVTIANGKDIEAARAALLSRLKGNTDASLVPSEEDLTPTPTPVIVEPTPVVVIPQPDILIPEPVTDVEVEMETETVVETEATSFEDLNQTL